MSITSRIVYSLFHHEPIAWDNPIHLGDDVPPEERYYAAQGNATRLFFRRSVDEWLSGWTMFHREPVVSFSYLFSGGYSKPAMYPESFLPFVQNIDQVLARWPSLFAARCLIGLTRV